LKLLKTGNFYNGAAPTTTTFNASGATVEYACAGIQNVYPTTYANLTISNTNTKTIVAALAVDGTTTINTDGILATAYTFTTNGPVNVNGTFQLNQGGSVTGSGTWTYGAAGTLVFNKTTAHTVYSDVFWPASGGPSNVSVQGVGGISMSAARTVSGTFQTSYNVNNANYLTINGTAQINTGGSILGSPTYGSSSTLKYNVGGSFIRNDEWTTATSGEGYPNNIQVSNATALNMGTSAAHCAGNLTVDASITLNTTSGGLTVGGSVISNGAISLGGDVFVGGNWTIGASGSQTNNSKAVFFNGATGDQTVSKTGGGTVYFDYLVVDKATSGNVVISSSPATDITINTTAGSVLQLVNTGGLELNGRTLALNNSGGGIYVNGTRNITSAISGGKLNINQYKYVANNSGTGSLAIGPNVTVNLNANGNLDFGNSGGYITTLNGTLSINSTTSCFVNTNPPVYGSGSLLKYNSGGTYGRGLEWSATSGAGYPANVQISNTTTVDIGANSGSGTARQCSGNLTVDALSVFTMNTNAMTAAVTVAGDVSNYGTITLSGSLGGDLKTNGSLLDNGTFNANNRAVFFNGGNAQNISGSGTFDISYVRINKSGGSVRLLSNLDCAGPNGSNAMEIEGAASILDLNGYTLTLGQAGVASTYNNGISSPGTIKGSTSSVLTILGAGALGTINFDQTTPGTTNVLQNFNIDRTAAGTVTLGNSPQVDGTLTLTNGTLNGTMTYGATGTLKYDGTSYTTTTTAEFPATSGPASLNVNNADAGGLSLHANRTLTGSLTIASAKKLNVPAGVQLSVTGTTTTNGGLVLQSPASQGESGSFLPSGTVTGSVTVERFIPAYTSGADGWHLLSSPVASQAIAPNFTPAANDDDLFRFNEAATDNLPWINYKGLTFSTFTSGEGYLAAYKTAGSPKSFVGTLNQSDVTLTNLTYTSANAWKGWHLLGNPFSCAILWNKTGGSWGALTNVEAVAQVMNSGGTYTARNANDPIPAMNGFMVHVSSATNTITIPLAARAHSTTDWYKNAGNDMEKLMLTASSSDNTTYVETMVVINPESTPGFDMEYDGHFLAGIEAAPQLWSQVGDEKLCVNTLPLNDETRIVSLGFIKGSSDSYTMNCTGIASINPSVSIVLEDTRAGKTQDLRLSPVYHFNAAGSDNASRFLLHFGRAFSVNDQAQNNTFHIYTVNNALYVTNIGGMALKGNVFVYNMTGQQVATKELSGTSETSLTVNLATGYYMVKAVTSDHVYSAKVFIKK
jgi:hypothetical protein